MSSLISVKLLCERSPIILLLTFCRKKNCKFSIKLCEFKSLESIILKSMIVFSCPVSTTQINDIWFSSSLWTCSDVWRAFMCQWAHFPHIHFGLMPDQTMKKTNVCQQVNYQLYIMHPILAKCYRQTNNAYPWPDFD